MPRLYSVNVCVNVCVRERERERECERERVCVCVSRYPAIPVENVTALWQECVGVYVCGERERERERERE